MQEQLLGDILAKRRDRAIAIVLGVKERECDRYLPPEARSKMRKVVLDQFNDIYEMSMDLVRSLDQGTVMVNEIYLQKLEEIHDFVSELRETG